MMKVKFYSIKFFSKRTKNNRYTSLILISRECVPKTQKDKYAREVFFSAF